MTPTIAATRILAFPIRLGRAPTTCDHCGCTIAPHSTGWMCLGGLFCERQHALDHHTPATAGVA